MLYVAHSVDILKVRLCGYERAKCIIKGLIIMLVFMAMALISSKTEVRAALGVKLSKTSLTFASDKAKAQTVTIKNIKKSNIKSVKISYYSKTWIKIKKKNKNQLVITPKLSTGNNYGIVDIIVEFKKPIKKEYRAYLSIKSIKIKGESQIHQLPKFEYAYYLKSKSTAVLYRTDPIAIPGAIGITDDELIDQSVFAGFDFDKVWTMTAEGPRLKNVYE